MSQGPTPGTIKAAGEYPTSLFSLDRGFRGNLNTAIESSRKNNGCDATCCCWDPHARSLFSTDEKRNAVSDLPHTCIPPTMKHLFFLLILVPTLALAQPDTLITYKQVEGDDLNLHVFYPHEPHENALAMVFFFGGGWNGGSPAQFYPHAAYFRTLGVVVITAEYRTKNSHGTSPFDSVEDAMSAIRWVRTHAARLGVDPDRIVASGGSAGGHLAAATAMLPKIRCARRGSFDQPGPQRSDTVQPGAGQRPARLRLRTNRRCVCRFFPLSQCPRRHAAHDHPARYRGSTDSRSDDGGFPEGCRGSRRAVRPLPLQRATPRLFQLPRRHKPILQHHGDRCR